MIFVEFTWKESGRPICLVAAKIVAWEPVEADGKNGCRIRLYDLLDVEVGESYKEVTQRLCALPVSE